MPYKNKQDKAASELRRYHARRAKMIDTLGGKCMRCGATESLEIDHINYKTKNFNVSKMWSMSWERIEAELKLCQLLCSPCHKDKSIESEDTALQRKYGSIEHGTISMYSKHKCRCEPCRLAQSTWKKEYRQRSKR